MTTKASLTADFTPVNRGETKRAESIRRIPIRPRPARAIPGASRQLLRSLPRISAQVVDGAAPLLGHTLDDRSEIRHAHDQRLAAAMIEASKVPLRDRSQRALFSCAPLDVMIERGPTTPRFHIIELNGTGFGGISNLPWSVVSDITTALTEAAATITESGVVLLGISGRECPERPRENRVLHEKLLFADALVAGLRQRHALVDVQAHARAGTPTHVVSDRPTVVLGYLKDLLADLETDASGHPSFRGQPVVAVLNDRFCLNMVDALDFRPDLSSFRALNACFAAGSDKAVAYGLLDELLSTQSDPRFPRHIEFTVAHDRAQLIRTVEARLAAGRQTVIKPHGTGLGHGIEFFLDPAASHAAIAHAVERSVLETETYYGVDGGAFPYTVCDFIDGPLLAGDHPLAGHKFEVRIVVFRRGDYLCAMPSVAKIASIAYTADAPPRMALINNVTPSTQASNCDAARFSMSMCRHETLDLLGLGEVDLGSLCGLSARYVRHVLDRLQDSPESFGYAAARELAR